jgi:hypothetical protein
VFVKILKAIEDYHISTIPEIARTTGVNEEIVKIAIDFWRKKGKINFQSADEVYPTNDCATCPLKNKCHIWWRSKRKERRRGKR